MHGFIPHPEARKAAKRRVAAIGGTDQRHGQGLAAGKGQRLRGRPEAWPANRATRVPQRRGTPRAASA